MSTKRRQLRRRQTRRRRVSRRQAGGGEAEDFPIIQSIYRHSGDVAELIAAIYMTPALYAKMPSYPVESPIGKGVIPDQYARPSPGKKPLNSVIKGAYNFFHPYAGKFRGSESEHAEYEMAVKINNKLQLAFITFMNTHPTIVRDRGEEHSIPASGGAIKRANKLYGQIANILEASARAERKAANAERIVRAREAEAREREYERQARSAAAAPAGGAGAAPARGTGAGPYSNIIPRMNARDPRDPHYDELPVLTEAESYLAKKGPVEFW